MHNRTEVSGEHENIVRVRGLPWSCSEQNLKEFFKECVGSIVKISFTYSREGRPNGEAYIEFASAEGTETALSKHKEYMGQRYVEVFGATRSEMEYVLRRSGQPDSSNSEDDGVVRCRGLPWDCTKDDIFTFFTGLDIVPNGILLPLDASGRSDGQAFIKFRDPGTANRALQKHMDRLGPRYIEVFRSSEEEVKRVLRRMEMGGVGGGYGGPGGNRPGPYSRGGGRGNFRSGPVRPMKGLYLPRPVFGGFGSPNINIGPLGGYDNWGPPGGGPSGPCYGPPQPMPGKRPGAHMVRMRGLPWSAKEADIAEFFKPLTVVNINIIYDAPGRSSGDADVEFYSHDDAAEAMKKDKEKIGTRYIELFLNSSASTRKPEGAMPPPPPPLMPSSGGGPYPGSGPGPAYDANYPAAGGYGNGWSDGSASGWDPSTWQQPTYPMNASANSGYGSGTDFTDSTPWYGSG